MTALDLPDVTPLPRLDEAATRAQGREASADQTMRAMLEAFPGPAVVLNDRRQIVAANAAFEAACITASFGVRPGDALGCVEAPRGTDGCGTAEACRTCGAGRGLASLESGAASPLRSECLITRRGPHGDESLEFEAGMSRLPGGWTLFALRDLSGEKRRRVLERCFLHDAINAAGAVQGLAELAAVGVPLEAGLIGGATEALIEELRHQQMLMAAESGDLHPHREPVDIVALCREVAALYASHPAAMDRRIVVRLSPVNARADRVLLRRVIVNLVKNACEAVPAGSEITITCAAHGGRAVLAVRNPGEMPDAVRLQLFRRSFSTKAAQGRGIGTWSVKLLTERYLDGTVVCDVGGGETVFTVSLPLA
jgi:nitrogen-specific signal transduction histidine kinase